jgi:hypothetical protein
MKIAGVATTNPSSGCPVNQSSGTAHDRVPSVVKARKRRFRQNLTTL